MKYIRELRMGPSNKDVILVDENMYEKLLEYGKWTINNDGYAVSFSGHSRTFLHHLVLSPPAGMFVDHINGIKSDCRLANLRLATPAQNSRNQRKHKDNQNTHKGVKPYRDMFQARICVNYKTIHLGKFKTEQEAALVYNKAAINYHGKFAKLNTI